MCRSIKPLFNFEPPATEDEIKGAALQYVRKVSGYRQPSNANQDAFDRAADNPGKKPEDMPPLRDVGSRLLTSVRVMQDYGIMEMGPDVEVDGYVYHSDCGPEDLGEDDLDLTDVTKGRKRLIVGAYEIFGDYKPQMMQALEAGRSCAIAGMVDYPFMVYSGGVFHKIDYSQAQGGHAMEIVGYKYEDGVRLWKLKNSWGKNWGIDGYAWVTDEFIDQLWSVYVMDCYLDPV